MMSLRSLRDSLPFWAQDTMLNLGSVVGAQGRNLTEQQHWGVALAAAAATGNARLLREVNTEAIDHLSEHAHTAALSAMSVMAMNSVLYRARSSLHGEYDDIPVRLRMHAIANPGVHRADFELFCVCASAVYGCSSSLESHSIVARDAGVTREALHDCLRIAAVVAATASVSAADEALTMEPAS